MFKYGLKSKLYFFVLALLARSELLSLQARLVTAVSGFPKSKSGYNIDNILKGQIGDDAYFVARHLDDWSNEQARHQLVPNFKSCNCNTSNLKCS